MKYIGSLYKSPMIPYSNAPDGFPRYITSFIFNDHC